MPVVDLEKCNGCGLCISVCSHNGLALVDKIVIVIETEECDWCTQCEAVCPTGAISCAFEIIIE
ncbi:ATP-binding protein [Chloroflexota bacterium]